MAVKQAMLEFLREHDILTLATYDGDNPWVSHLYFVVDDEFTIYFVTGQTSRHSQHLESNCCVAFGAAESDATDHRKRIGIQGRGVCKMVTDPSALKDLVSEHNARFPDMAEQITFDYIADKDTDAYFRGLKPSYIKFWNDKLLADKKTAEFTFDNVSEEECLLSNNIE